MERFLDLSNRQEVIGRVLEDWLLRELRDELASRLTWKEPGTRLLASRLHVRLDEKEPVEVFYLSPVGLGGKFFYERPVGEALYSADCNVIVGLENGSRPTPLVTGRLYWVGSDEPRGYRITEGIEELFESLRNAVARQAQVTRRARSS